MSKPDYKTLQRGEKLADIGRFREALTEFYKFLASQPQNYTTLCQISRCHYELGELQIALNSANTAIAAAPENEWAYRLKSIAFRASGNHRKSLKSAEECVSKAPHSVFSLQNLAYAQISVFLLEDAGKTLKIMLKTAPENAMTHDACGFLALKKEDYAAAEKHFLQALKIDPESANSLNNLGVVYLEKSRQVFGMFKKSEFGQKAKECFLSALKINPNSALARQNLQASENNRFYFGGQKNRIILKFFLFFAAIIIFSRIVNSFVPVLINHFTPYQPSLFYLIINAISVMSIFFLSLHLFALRRSDAGFDSLSTFFGRSKKLLFLYCTVMLVPQVFFGFFIAFLEVGVSAPVWIASVFAGAVSLGAAINLFRHFSIENL